MHANGTKPRRPRRLLFYTHGLVDGGAERVWALLASHFARSGDHVIFAVDFAAQDNAAFLAPEVQLRVLGGGGHGRHIARLAKLLARERPDCALSAVAGSNLKLVLARLLAGLKLPVVLSYHGVHEYRTGLMSRLTYFSQPVISRTTAATVCVSDGLCAYMKRVWRSAPARTVRIHNPVFLPERVPAFGAAELAGRPALILAVGRLVADKNFALLVRAMARPELQEARLVILGEGEERGALEALVKQLGLESRVELPGHADDPWPWYEKARCLALSSDSESFGNVVVEALAFGLPVVATACAGPEEILSGPELGRIVPRDDERALAAALARTLAAPGDPEPRQARARDFSLAAGCGQYEALLRRVMPSSGP